MRRKAAVRNSVILTTWLLFLAGTQLPAQERGSAHGSSAHAAKPPTILFMCPHGAAKSVLASAYFQRLAKERGLNVRVDSAGTEPDAAVSPAVAAHLERQGYTVPVVRPRKATAGEVAAADVVISIGCDLSGLPAPRGQLQRWDEVPALSDDFARADEAIRKRVTDLIDELVRAQVKR
jgi:arsenate reductase (thioredoxin)